MPDITPFWISLKVAISSTLIVLILGILIARWLYQRHGVIARVIESFIVLPIVLPPTVMGFILLIIFSPKYPLGHFYTSAPYTCRLYLNWCNHSFYDC